MSETPSNLPPLVETRHTSKEEGVDNALLPNEYTQGSVPAWKKRVMAGVAVVGALVGSTVSTEAAVSHEGQGIVQHYEANDTDPIVGPVPPNVIQDFTDALAVDTCDTRVNIDQVTSLYQRLWMTEERPDMTLDGLQERADGLIQAVENDRKTLGRGKLPEGFTDLYRDATNGNKLPVEIYENMAKTYFASLGIDAQFDWSSDPNSPGYDASLARIYHEITPLTDAKKTDPFTDVRLDILRAISDTSYLPESLIRDPQIENMFFGRATSSFSGQYFIDQKAIAYDITQPVSTIKDTVPHEGAHNSTAGLCGLMLYGRYATFKDDPAYISLNNTFQYDESNEDRLGYGTLIQGEYTSLRTAPVIGGKAVAYEAYGTRNFFENIAVDNGGALLNSDKTPLLFRKGTIGTDNRDRTIMQEKMTLELARFSQKHPEEGKYVEDLIRVSRLQQLVTEKSMAYDDTLEHYRRAKLVDPSKDEKDIPFDMTAEEVLRDAKFVADLERALKEAADPTARLTRTLTQRYLIGSSK